MRKDWMPWGVGAVCTYHLTNSTALIRPVLRYGASKNLNTH